MSKTAKGIDGSYQARDTDAAEGRIGADRMANGLPIVEPTKTVVRRKPSSALQAAGQIEAILEKFDGPDINRILSWVSGSFRERLFPLTQAMAAETPSNGA